MNFLKLAGSSIFQFVSLIFLLVYLLGAMNIYFSDRNDYCVMTYMFEYPQFVRITIPENKLYPQYALYAYSEGRLTEKTRKMWFDGVPVLFLPGNSGSHMQGRSLASVALRKALSGVHDYHFDFFTVSFNEDLSGVYGGVLQSETEFTAACIAKILSLYKNNKYTKSVPTSVILIGHSMGGLIAKRLLAYPETLHTANIAITLAAPLQAPVINFDMAINDYYKLIDMEWNLNVKNKEEVRNRKMLLSFGNGPRDVLMPSGLTSSNENDISVLTTAVPGVWVSPDHVSIVWCKQLVMSINRFLFDIVDLTTEQLVEDKQLMMKKARQYFQANRSMTVDPNTLRSNVTMTPDGFWYEDNRRIYQVSRPKIEKTTYLMVRLVSFPQNRFVAIESVNLGDKDWLFGCSAAYTYGTHRYCKEATSLTELTRWSGAASTFGKRKLAAVKLHDIMDAHPEWTHVIVRVSPTDKPVTLNVDINDHASRQLTVNLPSDFSFTKTIIKQQTEPGSLYYELVLPGFEMVHQAYFLFVEPSECKASQYHASAEMHVPWASGHEVYHYFTHIKRTPMKLRLYKSNPNATLGLTPSEHVKITLLLDPQCVYTISISTSWYHRLAQLARNYTPAILPYIAAILLLAARSNIQHLNEKGTCISIHGALMSEGVKPYYALVFSRLAATVVMSVPFLSYLLENASTKNEELQYFTRSFLVLPAYMAALGAVNLTAAALLGVMLFSSQLAHRLLFRIVWRGGGGGGGGGVAERVAAGLHKVPMLVSGALVCAAPLACGAAALAAGAAFYAFMISKMYEEYLEDYVYKLMAKIASKICRMFKSKKEETPVESTNEADNLEVNEIRAIEGQTVKQIKGADVRTVANINEKKDSGIQNKKTETKAIASTSDTSLVNNTEEQALVLVEDKAKATEKVPRRSKTDKEIDEELNNLHFHMMMFLMWLVVAAVNVPALLTWARNFKYSAVLKPDTSYHTGLVMAACSTCVWQMEGPRYKLRHYDTMSALLFTMAVFILALGPLSWYIVNYGVTLMFTLITLQQLFDKSDEVEVESNDDDKPEGSENCKEDSENSKDGGDNGAEETSKTTNKDKSNEVPQENEINECECSESRIFNVFKHLREKFTATED